jgi:hypothetical protein
VTTLVEVGETTTEMVAAVVNVIVAAPLLLASRFEVAVSATFAGLGSEPGAV